jgi:hypothetical protein
MFPVVVLVMLAQMNLKPDALDATLFRPVNMEVITFEVELCQLALEAPGIHTDIQQACDEHITADATNEIQIKRVHNSAIWRTSGSRPPKH